MVEHDVRIDLQAVGVGDSNKAEKRVQSAEARPHRAVLVLLAKVIVVVRRVAHVDFGAGIFAGRRRPDSIESKGREPRSQLRQVGIPVVGVVGVPAVPPECFQNNLAVPGIRHVSPRGHGFRYVL